MRQNLPVTDDEVKLNESSCILSTTNPKGQITYVNQDFLDISGFTDEELLGQPHNIVRHPDMPPAAFEDMWNHLKAGKTWMGLVKNRCKNGDYYWVNAFTTPVMENGQLKEYQSVRVMAQPEEIARAEKLYADINAGKSLHTYTQPLPLRTKLLAAIGLSFLPMIIAIFMQGGMMTTLGATMVSLMMALGSTSFLLNPISRSITEARNITHNPLMQYVFTGDTSESGQVHFALRKTTGELKAVVGRLEDSSKQFHDITKCLDQDISLTQQGIIHQSGENKKVLESINELSDSATLVAQNADDSSEATLTAQEEASSSAQVVNETIKLINELAHEVENSTHVVNQLKEDSNAIGAVLDVISGIAEQTNLLALNAAIEAARAGEQGRGFAVVADEVRTLASRTADSTQEIKTIINNLQTGANDAVLAMDTSQSKAQKGVKQINKAGASLTSINEAVETINEMNIQVASAAKDQSHLATDINERFTSIQEVHEITVDSMASTQNNSNQIRDMAGNLHQLAGQFWNR